MSALVVDASVVAKLLFEEDGSAEAEAALLRPRTTLVAPDLLLPETAGVIWKRVRRNALSVEDAEAQLDRLLALPVELVPSRDLIAEALQLAIVTDRTVYDCLYVALALMSKATLLTADERLVNALRGTAAGKRVRWLMEQQP